MGLKFNTSREVCSLDKGAYSGGWGQGAIIPPFLCLSDGVFSRSDVFLRYIPWGILSPPFQVGFLEFLMRISMWQSVSVYLCTAGRQSFSTLDFLLA